MKQIPELQEYDPIEKGDAIVIREIPNELYHSELGISSSFVRKFGESQIHAVETEQETTPAMNFGTAAHYMLVEGEAVFNDNVGVIVGSPYTKVNKELKQDFIQRGLVAINEKDYLDIEGMRSNIIPEADMYLNGEGKIAEASFYWYEDDVLCKCRPDVICNPQGPHQDFEIVAVDYKTTYSCSPESFLESVLKYGYAQQAAWYRRGLEAAGYRVKEFVFVAQEKKEPYASKIFKITDKQMDKAWLDMKDMLESYKKYLKGTKPTIHNSPNIVTLELEE
tara:strand:+ start:440 stop:1276 length:837 start_codon:yes stop_codon:yes gene_type:complete